jgi:putative addiction module killer protein
MGYHWAMGEVREYLDEQGRSPFARWFKRLNTVAAAKVTTALIRMEHGNLSNVRGVGAGVFENKVDFGPGYRVYFGKDGDTLIVLVGGGTKEGQSEDIETAKKRWQDYRRRKKRQHQENA